jgi:hypothetical protein
MAGTVFVDLRRLGLHPPVVKIFIDGTRGQGADRGGSSSRASIRTDTVPLRVGQRSKDQVLTGGR